MHNAEVKQIELWKNFVLKVNGKKTVKHRSTPI